MTTHIPHSIGIIMDGNRRWAKERNLPTLEGHRVGYDKLREVVSWCKESGIESLTVYAFSTENWHRSKEEVGYLMDLIRRMIKKETADAIKEGTRLVFPGDLTRFEDDIRESLRDAVEKTKDGKKFTLAIALSYGGRTEILDAIHRIPKEKLESVSEEEFSALLWTSGVPDPDLILRTSGEQRLSGFLTWQSVYSELFFTETFWPAFSKEEFSAILDAYAKRSRRFGT